MVIWQPPQRVVSIVPVVSEILSRIGAGDAVCGVTYHDIYPSEAATKSVIGGFFVPCMDRIDALQPDTIFAPAIHDTVLTAYAGQNGPRLILASRIYADEFADLPSMGPDGRVASRSLSVALDYIGGAEVVDSVVNDYIHKTLLIHLNGPMAVASTLEGFRDEIRHVGNSYSPPQVWERYHRIGLDVSRKQLMQSIGRDPADTSLLFTGADMDNLSVQRQQFKEMTVYALITAGVRSNAVRMAEDVGAYYEPGTINMIILTNTQLTQRAMHRAIISATEAKTAALQDLDVRSSYTPLTNPATGTGTDNIVVVEGSGTRIDNTGGHSKMGELIGRAVHAGVQEAIFKQNGIGRQRLLLQRLKEREITLLGLADDCSCGISGRQLTAEVQRLLME
ncbi:MAG: adenosylcobinamide amidohydrolase, partial [Desulfosarcina sp.]